MTKQEIQKRWALFQGKRQRPPETIKRTEEGVTYEMPVKFDKRYSGWSRRRREENKTYCFTHFFKYVLTESEQKEITVIHL